MKEADKDNDSRLSRDEFHHLVQFISSDYIGMEDDEDFFELVQALDTNIEVCSFWCQLPDHLWQRFG